MGGRKDLRNTEDSLLSLGNNPFKQTLLVVLIDNEHIGPTLYSEFHKIKVLGIPKTSDKHGSKGTMLPFIFIYGIFFC